MGMDTLVVLYMDNRHFLNGTDVEMVAAEWR